MNYGLGVDLGTTFVAAAVARPSGVEMVTLGDRSVVAPSVVLLRQNGAVLTGSAAQRRASIEPERVAREFKRRLGDPIPLIVGGAPQPVTSLLAHLLRSVVAKVTAAEGAPPSVVTLTHPANWGPYKRELFDQVPQLAEIPDVQMVTEPEAAAAHYASTERVADGATVAVYDLGGGTFDATVLRKTGGGFEILGKPQGIEGLGGIDFDEAVFAHVQDSLGDDVTVDRASLVRLREECVLAKETLSADTEATIPVLLPGMHTHIQLSRGEFEDMIRPALADTLTTLRGALRSASVTETNLTAVLLVGGSSRIPLVAKMVSAELKCPIAVDTHPKHAVALGAAALNTGVSIPPTPTPAPAQVPTPRAESAAGTYPGAGPSAYRPPVHAGFVEAARSHPSDAADHPDHNAQQDTAHPRFGPGDAPPPLASTPKPRTAMPTKRYALLLGALIALAAAAFVLLRPSSAGLNTNPARLTLTTPQVKVGNSYFAAASGCFPGENVRFSWTGPTNGVMGTFPADSGGNSVHGPIIERDPPGNYEIIATGLTSGHVASAALQVVASDGTPAK